MSARVTVVRVEHYRRHAVQPFKVEFEAKGPDGKRFAAKSASSIRAQIRRHYDVVAIAETTDRRVHG